MIKFKLRPHVVKKYFKLFINLNYIIGFLYAFYFFLTTSRKENMFVRRLWAYECWIILSFYGLFIYLFYLEKSALEDRRGLFRFMRIQALDLIQASKTKLVSWFEHIADHPQAYSFKTHQGIFPLQGKLTEPGSIFTTKEKFAGVKLELKFKTVTANQDDGFIFKLIGPGLLTRLGIRGKFSFKAIDQDETRLELTIYNHPANFFSRIASALFYLSPVRLIVARQLRREVRFIRKQVEEFSQEE